jgi:O-antigen/teichoic acid export membrane protein
MTQSIKYDIVSNYIATATRMALRFLMIPVYLKLLGVSAFGLIGFSANISSLMVILDFGMGCAAMKTLAEGSDKTLAEIARLLRTVELIYLVCAIVIGMSLALSSNLILRKWLSIDDPTLNGRQVLLLIAALITVTWPQSLYGSFLAGQKQFVNRNLLEIFMEVTIAGGMLYFLAYRNRSIECYFSVMIVGMSLKTIGLRVIAWRKLPWSWTYARLLELRHFYKFAAGVSIFSLSSLVLFQAPALYISAKYSTSTLGLYGLAETIPMAMLTLLYPISSALFPRLVNIRVNVDALDKFTQSATLVTILIFSFVMVTGTNMQALYTIWLKATHDVPFVASTSSILLIGVMLYSSTLILNTTLLANGYSGVVGMCHAIAAIALVIALFIMGSQGLRSVLYCWLLSNAILLTTLLFAYTRISRTLISIWWSVNFKYALFLLGGSFLIGLVHYVFTIRHPYVSFILSVFMTAGIFGPSLVKLAFPFKRAFTGST